MAPKYKIFVSPRYHQNADKDFLRHCEYIAPSDKKGTVAINCTNIGPKTTFQITPQQNMIYI